MKNKLQTLRGIACIGVVYFHLIGNGETGLKLDANNTYSMIADFLAYIRMPLFTFLSGYVYAYRRFDGGAVVYMTGKTRRIILPLIAVSSLFAVIQFNTPNVGKVFDQELWSFFLYPYAHFWFLHSIFTLFIIIALVDNFSQRSNKALWALALISIPLFFYSLQFTSFFSFNKTLYLLPFFLCGIFANIYKIENINIKYMLGMLVAFLLLFTVHVNNLLDGVLLDRLSLLALLIGLMGSLLLLRFCFSNKYLMYIGGFSYTIYLFHVFGTAASRIFLNKLGDFSVSTHVLIGLFLGITLPIITHLVIAKISFLRPFFLGLKWQKSLKTRK